MGNVIITCVPIAAFYCNKAIFIGDKQCWVTDGATEASDVEMYVAGERNVADAWQLWSTFGIVCWGLFMLAHLTNLVAACMASNPEGNPEGLVAAIPIAMGAGCCTVIAILCCAGFTIWGSILRFGEDGELASQIVLKQAGLWMMIELIVHYVIVGISACICCCVCCTVCLVGGGAAAMAAQN